jgi:Flp pilus assembly protein TadB
MKLVFLIVGLAMFSLCAVLIIVQLRRKGKSDREEERAERQALRDMNQKKIDSRPPRRFYPL